MRQRIGNLRTVQIPIVFHAVSTLHQKQRYRFRRRQGLQKPLVVAFRIAQLVRPVAVILIIMRGQPAIGPLNIETPPESWIRMIRRIPSREHVPFRHDEMQRIPETSPDRNIQSRH